MGTIGEFFDAIRGAQRFRGQPPERRRIVFYSEGATYWKYFATVVQSLIEDQGETFSYLTSDPTDPILQRHDPRIDAFFIGDGLVRTFVFQTLKAGVMVMTMPDLENFHIKRSLVHPVHYAYLHHSLVSTHMIYREDAFDHFDSILCAGPHHREETRAWEKLKGLPEKRLFDHGYAPIDELMNTARTQAAPEPLEIGGLNVLLAPSWGPEGILERGAEHLLEAILEAGHRAVVRPHPRTRELRPETLVELARRFAGHPRFLLDEDTSILDAIVHAHIMISDWSGAAMEFAFGLERPVIFIDVPRKINNPRYTDIAITPLEDFYRQDIGAILNPDRMEEAPALIQSLCASPHAFTENARTLRNKWLFNPGTSGARGARIIAELAKGAHTNSQ